MSRLLLLLTFTGLSLALDVTEDDVVNLALASQLTIDNSCAHGEEIAGVANPLAEDAGNSQVSASDGEKAIDTGWQQSDGRESL